MERLGLFTIFGEIILEILLVAVIKMVVLENFLNSAIPRTFFELILSLHLSMSSFSKMILEICRFIYISVYKTRNAAN